MLWRGRWRPLLISFSAVLRPQRTSKATNCVTFPGVLRVSRRIWSFGRWWKGWSTTSFCSPRSIYASFRSISWGCWGPFCCRLSTKRLISDFIQPTSSSLSSIWLNQPIHRWMLNSLSGFGPRNRLCFPWSLEKTFTSFCGFIIPAGYFLCVVLPWLMIPFLLTDPCSGISWLRGHRFLWVPTPLAKLLILLHNLED